MPSLSLPALVPLVPPSLDRAAYRKWLEEEGGGSGEILDFLGVDKGDRQVLEAWLCEQKPVEEWTESVLLAKALRNATRPREPLGIEGGRVAT